MRRWLISISAALAVAVSGVPLPASAAPAAPAVLAGLPAAIDPATCPEVTPGAFGAAPAGPLGGGDCRRLVVETAGRHMVQAVDERNVPQDLQVYDGDGEPICSRLWCDLATGTYTLVADVTTAFATTFVPLQGGGCVPAAGRGYTEAQTRQTIDTAGQVNCLEVAGGAGTYQAALPENERNAWPYFDLVQPSGTVGCRTLITSGCALSGGERLITMMPEGRRSGGYVFALQRVTGSTGCPELPAGDFGDPRGASVAFTGDDFIACFTAAGHTPREIISVSRSGADDAFASLRVLGPNGAPVCGAASWSPAPLAGCQLPETGPYTVVVRSQSAGGGKYLTARVDASGTNCGKRASTDFGGVATRGSLRLGEIHCYRNDLSWVHARGCGGAVLRHRRPACRVHVLPGRRGRVLRDRRVPGLL